MKEMEFYVYGADLMKVSFSLQVFPSVKDQQQLVFLMATSGCGVRLRSYLGMLDGHDEYFDPGSAGNHLIITVFLWLLLTFICMCVSVSRFLSLKRILWLYVFVHFSPKKNFFFFRNQEILCFLCVLGPGDHFTKSRPVSCGQNLDVEKFQFQIISKPFDRSTSYLVWWYKKIIDI